MPITPARQGRFVGLRFLSLLSSFTPITPTSRIARLRRGLLWPVLISGAALLAACGGGGGGGGGGGSSGPSVTISGTATYDFVPPQSDGIGLDYNAITQKPIRGATVQLLSIDDLLLDTTVTDAQGFYSLSTNQLKEGMKIRVRAELLDNTSPGTYAVTVRDNTANNALYVLDSDVFTPTASETRNLRASSGWGGSSYTGTRAAAPFAVLDVAYQGLQKVLSVAPNVNLPSLRMYWSKENTTSSGNIALGQIGTSFFTYSGVNYSLYLLGKENVDTDEYDTHVVAHEFGHYLQRAISADDSVGGMHAGGDLLDMRVAFSEGWGNAWAGIVMNDPVYTDSSGSKQTAGFKLDVSAPPTNTTDNVVGFFSESTAQYLIWSLNDNNAIGFTPIYNALVALKNSPQFTSLYSFGMAVKNAAGANATTVTNLWAAQSIVLADAYGLNETNFGANTWAGEITTASPVYRNHTAGTAQQYCLDNTANDYDYFGNKLGNSKFVKFTVPSTNLYTLVLTPAGGLTGTAPRFYVITSTGTRLQSVAEGADLARKPLILLNGGETHVAALTDNNMDYDDTLPRCFAFLVTPSN